MKKLNYKTQLLGNNCSTFKIFLEQTESHLQNRNLTESSYDNIIDSIQNNTKSIDEYFYKSSIRVVYIIIIDYYYYLNRQPIHHIQNKSNH